MNAGEPKPWRSFLLGDLANRVFRRRLLLLVLLGAGAFVILKWLLVPVRISGISMEPNYHEGTLHLVNRLSYYLRSPQRGDVVAIRQVDSRAVWLSRVVGLPGERVAMVTNTICINGNLLAEPYASISDTVWDLDEIRMQTGQFFVVGDNRAMDQDAHDMGAVEAKRILGKVWY